MSDQRDEVNQLAFSRGSTDPSEYSSPEAKARFAVAKYYGMGSDSEWSVEEIANTLGVTSRQVYRYLNESEIGRETREVKATTEAEWQLNAALILRKEIEWLEDIEEELLQRTKTAPINFENQKVKGTPTRDGQVILVNKDDYTLTIPIPSEYKEVVEYGSDLKRIQKEKRKYIDQICMLLGLDDHDRSHQEHRPSEGSDAKPVQFREVDDETSG
jgi:transposase-like protein